MIFILTCISSFAQQTVINYTLALKSPGNPSVEQQFDLVTDQNFKDRSGSVNVVQTVKSKGNDLLLTISIDALKESYISLSGKLGLDGFDYESSQFYMPGFWYRKNLRSPEKAPSAKTSKSWIFREDRLSTPLTGAYSETNKSGTTLLRYDVADKLSLAPLSSGEVILSGPTNLGALGFESDRDDVSLTFSMPYREAPKTYYRKLQLGDPITAFLKVEAGEKISFQYLIKNYQASDYSDFVRKAWMHSYDQMQPEGLERDMSDERIKETLSQFWKQSVVEGSGLKGYSGVHLETESCESHPILEVGFVGRVLLNAFNALEYGYAQNDGELIQTANEIWDSYLANGFSKNGFFRERVNYETGHEPPTYSIRRQSEGLYATLFYLDFERRAGRRHPEWEQRARKLLASFEKLQKEDGSYPRKFSEQLQIDDSSGGSSSCAVPALVMAHKYFGDKRYLDMARKVADYQEKEQINKADYFSSTLDANCEDKEASLYVATSLYYLAQVTRGKEKQHYIRLAKKASYFALSWYYTWDVPFAQGQMLGDLGMKTRGWGNVSVENNHIDVYIFEFDEILDWLAEETAEPRFSAFANVIRSSMRSQLLPYEGHMVGIGKVGYYPEVVQHTQWDYGHNGKGFYNKRFAPGWTVASLWELLMVGRTEAFFD